tara:strand:+ start:179 stop:466 length:288 start_codon:yes stop_codon:yes gene_type:complete
VKVSYLGGFMSRTYRNPIAANRFCRKPRHKGALVAASDEYGIRKGAIPPTDYADLPLSAWNEDFKASGKLEAKNDIVYKNQQRERTKHIDPSIAA